MFYRQYRKEEKSPSKNSEATQMLFQNGLNRRFGPINRKVLARPKEKETMVSVSGNLGMQILGGGGLR